MNNFTGKRVRQDTAKLEKIASRERRLRKYGYSVLSFPVSMVLKPLEIDLDGKPEKVVKFTEQLHKNASLPSEFEAYHDQMRADCQPRLVYNLRIPYVRPKRQLKGKLNIKRAKREKVRAWKQAG